MGGDSSMPIGPQTNMEGITVAGPTGPGWVVELKGHHFYKGDRTDYGPLHVRNTLLKQLKDGEVELPLGAGKPSARFKMKELGIGYAILAYSSKPRVVPIPNPNYAMNAASSAPGAGPGMPGGLGGPGGMAAPPSLGVGVLPSAAVGIDPSMQQKIDPNNPPYYEATFYEFAVQFAWVEKPLNVRLEEIRKAKEEAEKVKAEADAAAANAAGGAGPGTAPGALQVPPVAPPPNAAAGPAQVAPQQPAVPAGVPDSADAEQPGVAPVPAPGIAPQQPGGAAVPQQPAAQPAPPAVPTIPELPPM